MDVGESGYMPAARDRCYGVGDTSSVEVAARIPGPRHVVGPAAATGLVLHSRDPPATEEKYLGTEVSARRNGKRNTRAALRLLSCLLDDRHLPH